VIAKIWFITQTGEKYSATERRFGTYNCDVWYNGEATGRALMADTLDELREQLRSPPYFTQPCQRPLEEGVLEYWW
jgi:hypothetical protein